MTYTLRSVESMARKRHPCIWCAELIEKGSRYLREVIKFDGELQDSKWHPECKAAANEYFRQSGEDSFEPHSCKRGTSESRD